MLFGLRAIFVLAAAVYLALFLHLGRKRPGVVSASGQSGG
jgi:hypothetical protein